MMKYFSKLIAVIIIMGISINCLAATVQSFSVPMSVGYESNLRLSTSTEQPVNRFTLNPRYSISSEQGANEWFSNASLNFVRSSDQSISQDRNDPSLSLGWKRNYETGEFAITGRLNDQSTRVSELSDSGIVNGDNTKKSRTLSVSWQNSLNERTSLGLSSSGSNVKFEGPVTTGLVNYRNESSNGKLSYSLNEQVETFTQFSYSRYMPEGNNLDSQTKSIDFGLSWVVSEKMNLSLSIGANEVKTGTKTTPKSRQASFSSQYTTLRSSTSLNFSSGLLPSSTGSVNESNQIAIGWRYSLKPRDNISLNYSWNQNVTLNKLETTQFSINYTRELNLTWDFRLSAKNKVRDDKLTNVSSHSIMASVIYKLADF